MPTPDATNHQCIQEVIGILLYYACIIDPTLLAALGTLAAQQPQGIQSTMEALTQLLNYCATHPDTTICHHASDMTLWLHNNASYPMAPKECSCVAGYYFLSSQS